MCVSILSKSLCDRMLSVNLVGRKSSTVLGPL